MNRLPGEHKTSQVPVQIYLWYWLSAGSGRRLAWFVLYKYDTKFSTCTSSYLTLRDRHFFFKKINHRLTAVLSTSPCVQPYVHSCVYTAVHCTGTYICVHLSTCSCTIENCILDHLTNGRIRENSTIDSSRDSDVYTVVPVVLTRIVLYVPLE
eukprot:SAG31_NODE_595_length_13695_cov_11.446896_5_plen_153_part_00